MESAGNGGKEAVRHQRRDGPTEEEIVDRVYAAVLEQRLPPRMKLSESKLCESFGVGRMRVRRSLLLLASQGIVDLQSNRGAFIACPDPKDAKDVFEARKNIETGIVRMVARTADKNSLKPLSDHLLSEAAARKSRNRQEVIRLSGEFHVKLAEASDNRVLKRIIRELVTRTSLIVGLFGVRGGSGCPEHEHGEILEALLEQESQRAEALITGHLDHIQAELDLSQFRAEPQDLVTIFGR